MERLEADRVSVDVVLVDQSFIDQHLHHRQRQRAIGAGRERDVLVALFSAQAAIRIDRDHPRAAAFRFLDASPQVHRRRDRIGAPQEDQLGVDEALHVHPDRAAECVGEAGLAGSRADRPVEQRGAEPMKKAAIHRRALHLPHRSRVAVRQDRLRIARGDSRQFPGDRVERLVPADSRELSAALGADALHRIQQSVGRVRAVEIPRDLCAEDAIRRRMRRGALDADRDTVANRRLQRAGVRAIVRARAANDRGGAAGRRHRSGIHRDFADEEEGH